MRDPNRFCRIWDLTHFKVGYQDFEEKGEQDPGKEIQTGYQIWLCYDVGFRISCLYT